MSSENFSEIINWKNVFEHSSEFKNRKSFRWAFIEEFFNRDFYERLYDSYPKLSTFRNQELVGKHGFDKFWNGHKPNEVIKDSEDKYVSKYFNKFYHSLFTQDFIENIRKFSGVPVSRTKHFQFLVYTKGGVHPPHIHAHTGPSTLVMMIYFCKNWIKGDPGGTYVIPGEDESIVFEPYNLDNSVMIFQDGVHAAHGCRRIKKDVERRTIQIILEEYSDEEGWSNP